MAAPGPPLLCPHIWSSGSACGSTNCSEPGHRREPEPRFPAPASKNGFSKQLPRFPSSSEKSKPEEPKIAKDLSCTWCVPQHRCLECRLVSWHFRGLEPCPCSQHPDTALRPCSWNTDLYPVILTSPGHCPLPHVPESGHCPRARTLLFILYLCSWDTALYSLSLVPGHFPLSLYPFIPTQFAAPPQQRGLQ